MPRNQVLIIDHDRERAREIAGCLEDAGYHVRQAAGRADGLPLLYQTRPDLILLQIPPFSDDGWETLSRIRLLTDTPLVLMIARLSRADRARGAELGVNDFLEEPTPAAVLAQVQARLRRSRPPPKPMPQRAAAPIPNPLRSFDGGFDWAQPKVYTERSERAQDRFLTPPQLKQIDLALEDIGASGEVRLIVQQGRLRFIAKMRTAELQPVLA